MRGIQLDCAEVLLAQLRPAQPPYGQRGCLDQQKFMACVSTVDRSIEDFVPVWSEDAINRVKTSSAAAIEAAAVCARNIGGNALVGLLLPQADTTSFTAWCSSSVVR